jgi:signal peptidase I
VTIPQQSTAQASAIATLYREAFLQGQALWFRVASGSMIPTIRVGDHVCIAPMKASEIQLGDIAVFKTSDGLVIHRIVRRRRTGRTIQLLQMADVALDPSWIEEQAVVGRVVTIRRQGTQIDLRHPIAQWCGRVTGYLRYRLYTWKRYRSLRGLLHKSSRLVVYLGYWCIRSSGRVPRDETTFEISLKTGKKY